MGAVHKERPPEGHILKVLNVRNSACTSISFGCNSQARAKVLVVPGPGVAGYRVESGFQLRTQQMIRGIEEVTPLHIRRQ